MTGSAWAWHEDSHTWEIDGRDCRIWMAERPRYCDRGRWLAHVTITGDRFRLWMDEQDGWPRYYFDLDRAKAEVEAWLRVRAQWLAPEQGEQVDEHQQQHGDPEVRATERRHERDHEGGEE